jgi:hypothetical protein
VRHVPPTLSSFLYTLFCDLSAYSHRTALWHQSLHFALTVKSENPNFCLNVWANAMPDGSAPMTMTLGLLVPCGIGTSSKKHEHEQQAGGFKQLVASKENDRIDNGSTAAMIEGKRIVAAC